MSKLANVFLVALMVTVLVGWSTRDASAGAPAAQVQLSALDWQTIGSDVRFHFQFHNPDQTNPSPPATGNALSQPYGAFVPNFGQIGSIDVPSLAPDSFFDIVFDVALANLPPSAETILPNGGPIPNPTLLICPGATPSYIHVISDCTIGAGATWSFSPLCTNWTATLQVDNAGVPGGPAPNPIPPGFFSGWICVSAAGSVNTGDTCGIDLNMDCGGLTATVHLDAEACDWSIVPVETSTWGTIKAFYR